MEDNRVELQELEQTSVSVVGRGGLVLADEECSLVVMLDLDAAWVDKRAAA